MTSQHHSGRWGGYELVHWSGHSSRLDRDLTRFGVDAYGAEELVAELGAAFCAARLGLGNRPRPDHAQYLASWLYLLEADPRTLFSSAALAQRALEYLHPPDLNNQHLVDQQPGADHEPPDGDDQSSATAQERRDGAQLLVARGDGGQPVADRGRLGGGRLPVVDASGGVIR